MDQPLPAHSSKTDRSLSHPTIQSDLDSQTAPPQARNNASGYSAALSHGQRTGFAGGMAGMRYPLPLFPRSDDPKRCIRRTITDYRGCRSSRAGCRLGRCGNRRGIAFRLCFVRCGRRLCGFVFRSVVRWHRSRRR